jgi:hypothetical protein
MSIRARYALRIGIAFLLVAGLLVPRARSVDRVLAHAQHTVELVDARSTRALDHAVEQLPPLSLERKAVLLACIDRHLACAHQDLVAAIEARDASTDELAALNDLEIDEYLVTAARLGALRERIAAT